MEGWGAEDGKEWGEEEEEGWGMGVKQRKTGVNPVLRTRQGHYSAWQVPVLFIRWGGKHRGSNTQAWQVLEWWKQCLSDPITAHCRQT